MKMKITLQLSIAQLVQRIYAKVALIPHTGLEHWPNTEESLSAKNPAKNQNVLITLLTSQNLHV